MNSGDLGRTLRARAPVALALSFLRMSDLTGPPGTAVGLTRPA